MVPVNGRRAEPAPEAPVTPSVPSPAGSALVAPAASNRRRSRILTLALVACAIVATAFIAIKSLRRDVKPWLREPPIIVVLQFTNLSPDDDSDVFVDGLTE